MGKSHATTQKMNYQPLVEGDGDEQHHEEHSVEARVQPDEAPPDAVEALRRQLLRVSVQKNALW